jgi:hypothetical protein
MASVIISGALANKPFNGGNAWSRLSWIQGFRKLGFDVYFVEQIGHDSCFDDRGAVTGFKDSVNLTYFQDTMARFGLSSTCALIYRDGEEVHGLSLNQLEALTQKASLLFNMSGHLTLPEVKNQARCRIFFDDDPGYTQFWHAAHNPGTRLWDHDFYFTIGENIGKSFCSIPTAGLPWKPTRTPVVLDEWPVTKPNVLDRFTTVASWRGSYGPVQYNGKNYGLKVHEFRKFIDAPQRSPHKFEIALQIHPADRRDLDSLLANGWQISDPRQVADSPDSFRRFVQSSDAEFSVAQGIYVETASGWFSDRTTRYLASGKPVLVQDTGLGHSYPIGLGLLTFRDTAELVEGARRISSDYRQHCAAARRLAEEYFDSNKVIGEITRQIGVKVP